MNTPALGTQTGRDCVRQALHMRRAWPSLGSVNAPSFARALRQRSLLTAPAPPLHRWPGSAGWVGIAR